MRFARRAVPLLLLLVIAAPSTARAVCAGDCGTDLATVPKSVEKYVKDRWKAVAKCAKKASPACPIACPQPDGTVAPYLLSLNCAALVACNLDALAETAYDTTWDDTGVCAAAPATDCGSARAATAGKLVSTKLVRRRTNKMNTFPKDVTKCVAKIAKEPSCGTSICDDAPDWIDGIFPLALSPTGHQSLPFSVAAPGEGVATLTIATVGSDWATTGSESVVVTYDLDGAALGQLVLYGGGTPTDYRVMLGPLTAGDHTIGLHPEKKISPAPKAPVSVTAAASVEAIPPGDSRYDFTRFAPILLGIDQDLNILQGVDGDHPGNARSDTPLIVYATAVPGSGLTTYQYVMIWSNEDGGTGVYPDLLIAKFGRTTDIENIFEVDVSDAGVLLEARFRPDETGNLATFTGTFRDGTHPIIRTATANGLIAEDGASTLAFGLPPFAFDDTGLQRELGMNLDPTSYVVMAKEMIHEKKIELPTGNAATKNLSDLRNYLYIDYDIDVSLGGQVLRGVAIVGAVTYFSDHALPFNAALNPRVAGGIGQLAIELPPGTQIGDIQQYGLRGAGTMSGTLNSANAFILDTNYLPTPPLTYTGPQLQSGTNPEWLVTP